MDESLDRLRINSMDEKMYWLGFSAAPGIGPVRFQKLLSHFGSAKDAWEAHASDKKEVIGDKMSEQLEKFRTNFSLSEYFQKLEAQNVWFVTLQDETYPTLLKEIEKPPFVLYGRGEKEVLQSSPVILGGVKQPIESNIDPIAALQDDTRLYVGVVGTRNVTTYGRQVTELLTGELVDAGHTIISGLALGVDAIAHSTTIAHKGKTIAVLGSGVDVCYPLTNQAIYDQIISGYGAVVSEYALGVPPSAGSFPARNRIIAGLSQGVVVTEGAEDSGSLITAEDAFVMGRKVFAVPGPITSHVSKGPIKLLQKGAVLVSCADDILSELGDKKIAKKPGEPKLFPNLSNDEKVVLALLNSETLHFDEIVKRSQIDSVKIGSILTVLELKGIIKTDNAVFFLTN